MKDAAEPTLSVRLGTPDEEDKILELALQAWEENGIRSVNAEKMRAMIRPALYLWEGLVGVIGDPGQRVEAAILLRVCSMWYSDDKILEEKAIFVHPDFRHGKIGRARMLTEFSKQIADGLKIPLLIGVLSSHRTEAKVKLYERQFGSPAGAFFLYNAKTGHESVTEH